MRVNIYKKVAIQLGIEEKDVKQAYESYWKFFKDRMKFIKIGNNISKEEFEKQSTVFSILKIGKFYAPYTNKVRDFKEQEYEDKKM